MIYSFDLSEPIVHAMVPQLEADVTLLARVHVDGDDSLRWGVGCVDHLLLSFLNASFPHLDVVWGVEDDAASNASVWGHVKPCVLLLTSGAFSEIAAACDRLATRSASFESKTTVPEGSAPANALHTPSRERLGVFALASLVAHELGHVYDGQFEDVPVDRSKRLSRAHELAADTWAMRACTQLAVLWARDVAGRIALPFEELLRAALDDLLVGYGLVDDIDWSVSWWDHPAAEHPPGAMRLGAAAVAVSEWLADHRVFDERRAGRMTVDVMAGAAEKLYWLRTGKELPSEIFLRRFLDLLADGKVIDAMRADYERFRAALPPRSPS